jgi:DNA-directed RNA polymerase specialized sigma24 family protein
MMDYRLREIREDPRRYFGAMLDARASAERLAEQIERWRLRAEPVAAPLKETGGVRGGGPSRLVENAVCEIADLIGELDRQVRRVEVLAAEMAEVIERTPLERRQRDVLAMRYVEGLSWRAVSCVLGVSRRRTFAIAEKIFNDIRQNGGSRSPASAV